MSVFSFANFINQTRLEYYNQSKHDDHRVGYWLSHKAVSLISLPSNTAAACVGITGMAISACTLGALKVALFAFKPTFSTGFQSFAEKTQNSFKEIFSNIKEIVLDCVDLVSTVKNGVFQGCNSVWVAMRVHLFSSSVIFDQKEPPPSKEKVVNMDDELKKITVLGEFLEFAQQNSKFITSVDLSKFTEQLTESNIEELVASCHNISSIVVDLSDFQGEVLSELSSLENLRSLRLSNCKSIEKLNVSMFPKLETLQLSHFSIDQLSGLTHLDKLETLEITDCPEIQEIDLSGLSKLKILTLNGINKANLQGIGDLKDLEELRCLDAPSIAKIPLFGLTNLKVLELFNLNVEELEGLHTLSNLRALHLKNCPKLQNLDVKNLDLTEILLVSLNLKKIQGFNKLKNLNKLIINNCNDLEKVDLSSCGTLERLTLLSLAGAEILGFDQCVNLKTLMLSDCKGLSLEKIAHFENIEDLTLREFDLEPLHTLKQLKKLKKLNLFKNKPLEKIDLNAFKSLEEVTVRMMKFGQVTGLLGLTQLRHLVLAACAIQEPLLNLTGLDKLEKLDIGDSTIYTIVIGDETVGVEKLASSKGAIHLKNGSIVSAFGRVKTLIYSPQKKSS